MIDNVNIFISNNFKNAISNELAYLRKMNGYSGKYLADMIGVSQQQISRYESAKTNITMETLVLILDILNCSLDNFLERVNHRMKRSDSETYKKFNYLFY